MPRLAGSLPTQAVERLVASRDGQPGSGVRGDALDRPSAHRLDESLLSHLLGEVDVTEAAGQRSDDGAELGAVDRFDGTVGAPEPTTGHSAAASGRTSMRWPQAFDPSAAI